MKQLLPALLFTLPALAYAQTQPPGLQPLPEPPPLAAGANTAADEPAITIRRRDGSMVEEYRANGKLYMIKITPTNAPPYYLVDEKGAGEFLRKESISGGEPKPPRWVLFSF